MVQVFDWWLVQIISKLCCFIKRNRIAYRIRILSANTFLQFKIFGHISPKKRRGVVKQDRATFADAVPMRLALLPLIWYQQSPSYNLQSLSMFRVLLPEVFLETESTLAKKLKVSSTQIIGTSPLAEDDKRLNNPFVDVSPISSAFPSLGSR